MPRRHAQLIAGRALDLVDEAGREFDARLTGFRVGYCVFQSSLLGDASSQPSFVRPASANRSIDRDRLASCVNS